MLTTARGRSDLGATEVTCRKFGAQMKRFFFSDHTGFVTLVFLHSTASLTRIRLGSEEVD